jgi:hypothetical protein
MNETNDTQVKDLLKQALRPANMELQRDLWPGMLRRLDERSQEKAVPWLDWALITVLVIGVLAFPHSIPIFLYYL